MRQGTILHTGQAVVCQAADSCCYRQGVVLLTLWGQLMVAPNPERPPACQVTGPRGEVAGPWDKTVLWYVSQLLPPDECLSRDSEDKFFSKDNSV